MTAPDFRMDELLEDAADEPGRLDPQLRQLLEQAGESDASAPANEGLEAMRRAYRQSRIALQVESAGVADAADLQVQTASGSLRLRLYRPRPFSPHPLPRRLPCLVYFHGGGFVLGDLDSHDRLCRLIAYQGQCAVAAVDYRLAPEHRFPAAVDDALAAVRWIHAQAAELGLEGSLLAVGGDSAGGALAAVTALGLRGQAPALALQLLFYPITDMAHELPSHQRFSEGFGLTRQSLLWLRDHYLGAQPGKMALDDWRVSPLRAGDLAGLPPACILVAGLDPLRDEGRAYAARLAQAGVPVTYEYFSGAIHGFALMSASAAVARHAIYRAGQALRNAFGGVGARQPSDTREEP